MIQRFLVHALLMPLLWFGGVPTVTLRVTLYDPAAQPIAGAVVTVRYETQIIASATTDAEGVALLIVPPSIGDGIQIVVRGHDRDGSAIATDGQGIQVFVSAGTMIGLRSDTGGLIIPDPFTLGRDGETGTVVAVAPRTAGTPPIAGSMLPSPPVPTTATAAAAVLPTRGTNAWMLGLLCGVCVLSAVVIVFVRRQS